MPGPAQLQPGTGVGSKTQRGAPSVGQTRLQPIVQAHLVPFVIVLGFDHHLLEQAGAGKHFALPVQALEAVGFAGLENTEAIHQASAKGVVIVAVAAKDVALAGVVNHLDVCALAIGVNAHAALAVAGLKIAALSRQSFKVAQRFFPPAMIEPVAGLQRPVGLPAGQLGVFFTIAGDGDLKVVDGDRLAGPDADAGLPGRVALAGPFEANPHLRAVVAKRAQRLSDLVTGVIGHLPQPQAGYIVKILGANQRQAGAHVGQHLAVNAVYSGGDGGCPCRPGGKNKDDQQQSCQLAHELSRKLSDSMIPLGQPRSNEVQAMRTSCGGVRSSCRWPMASDRCSVWMDSLPARSAMVRATRTMRWWARADRRSFSQAASSRLAWRLFSPQWRRMPATFRRALM